MKHKLEADGIQLSFDGRQILSSIYIKCETGKITGLLGRNGQGKSCLLKIIYGTLPCEKSVRFDQTSIVASYKRPDLIRFLPQFNFIPKLLTLRRIFNDFDLAYDDFQRRFPGFENKCSATVGSLSGGERRLVELYVILKSSSQFAIFDEPFTHLDPLQIEQAKKLLHEEKENKGLLVTDHLYWHITELADSLYVLNNGSTQLTGSADEPEISGYTKR